MTTEQIDEVNADVEASSEETKMRRVFDAISEHERTIKELSDVLGISISSVRCAILALRRQRLIRPEAREKLYCVTPGAVAPENMRGKYRRARKDGGTHAA